MNKSIAIPEETYSKMLESYDKMSKEMKQLQQQTEELKLKNTPV